MSRVTEVGDYCRTADGDELWDEKLTEDQIDVICGTYKVEREEGQGKKGERNDGTRETDRACLVVSQGCKLARVRDGHWFLEFRC